jgi:predicted nucleotidyltransferase
MTDGLKENERRGIHAVLQRFPKVERGILFGSRATGTFRAASDIDLALEGRDIRLPDLISIRTKIEDLNLPIEVEFVVRNRIKNPAIEQHIDRYGVEWYERPLLRVAEESEKPNK